MDWALIFLCYLSIGILSWHHMSMIINVCDIKDRESRLVRNARKYIIKNYPIDERFFNQEKLETYVQEHGKKVGYNPKIGIRITMIILWPVLIFLFSILLLTARKK